MDWKKLGMALLFPPIAIMIVLAPVSAIFLAYSMVFRGSESPIAIVSYALAAYTLMVWCLRIPHLVKGFQAFKSENKYVRIWQNNTRLRVVVSLYGAFIYNAAYAIIQLGMGLWHHSFWFCSLAGYYFSLAVMRFFLARHTTKYSPG